MALRGDVALSLLSAIGNANAKGEYYLTDAVEVARAAGLRAVAAEADEDEVAGVNSRLQLAEAESILQKRLRRAAMAGGATLIAPKTVFFSADTRLGRDVIIEPNVVFGPGVTVEDEVVIHAFCHLEGAHLESGVSIGPYARLRPGTRLGAGVRIGNFVETKAARIDAGAKVNHLSYVGDAHVGAGANIGAGTITCNYDGFSKHRTEIGAGAFIGTNSSLVAPVTVGAGAYIGSGSVTTDDVPAEALAPRPEPDRLAHLGVHAQKQPGLNWIGVGLELVGKLDQRDMRHHTRQIDGGFDTRVAAAMQFDARLAAMPQYFKRTVA
eukprot:gene1345-1772_t